MLITPATLCKTFESKIWRVNFNPDNCRMNLSRTRNIQAFPRSTKKFIDDSARLNQLSRVPAPNRTVLTA